MAEVDAPSGDQLCAGIPHNYSALDVTDCLTVEWFALTLPAGVSEDDILYSAQNSLQTQITVPVQGDYTFTFSCCRAA